MAKRLFHATNYTPTATADTTALANGTYQAIKGGSSTQRINITEIFISGLASASAPTLMQMARVTTVETTPTALASPNSDGPKDPSTAALAAPAVTFVAAAAGPQRSAATSDAKMDLSLNAFGGIICWKGDDRVCWSQIGNTQPLGESVLSAFTGFAAGAVSSHLEYEPL